MFWRRMLTVPGRHGTRQRAVPNQNDERALRFSSRIAAIDLRRLIIVGLSLEEHLTALPHLAGRRL